MPGEPGKRPLESLHGRHKAATIPRRLVHEALIYDDDDQLVETVVPFLRAGVAAGEPTLLAVDAGHERLLLEALGDARGVEVLAAGQYSRPYEAMRNNHALYRRRLSGGAARLRVVGTVPSEEDTWHGWSCYEAGMNRLVADLRVWAICLYDARDASPEVLADVRSTHTHLTSAGGGQARNPDFVEPEEFLTRPRLVPSDPLQDGPPHLEMNTPILPFASTAVTGLAATTDLDAVAIDGLGRAVVEVLSNAVRHGRPPVRLRAWLADDRVIVTIQDQGSGPVDPCVGFAGPGAPHGLRTAYEAADVTLDYGEREFRVHVGARSG